MQPGYPRIVWPIVKAVTGVATGAMLCLILIGVARLTRLPYAGFHVENHYRCILQGPVSPPLSEGDILTAIDGHPLVQADQWRQWAERLHGGDLIVASIQRGGREYKVRTTWGELEKSQPSFQPESLAVLVKTPPKDGVLHAGDRILSVDGISVTPANAEEIDRRLEDRKKPLKILALSLGRLQVLTLPPAGQPAIQLEVIQKFPVFVTEVNPDAKLDLKPGDQLLNLNNQPIWNRTDLESRIAAGSFGSPLILGVLSKGDFRTLRTTLSLSRWEEKHPATLLYLCLAIVSFAISLFLLVRLAPPLMAVAQALVEVGLLALLASSWTLQFASLQDLQIWLMPALLLMPPALILFLGQFPVELIDFRSASRRMMLAGGWLVLWLAVWAAPIPFLTLDAAVRIAGFGIATVMLQYCIAFLLSTREPYEKAPLTVTTIGVAIGLWVPLAGLAMEVVFPATRLSTATAVLVFLAINLSLTQLYGYVRKRVLYTDVIFKKSLTFTLVTGVILFLYFVLIARFGSYIQRLLKITDFWIMLLFLLLAAFLVEPLKNGVIALLDKFVFRNQASYREYILDTSKQMNYLLDIPTIIDLTLNKICDVAYLSGGYFLLWNEAENAFACGAARNPETPLCRNLRLPGNWQLVAWLRDRQAPIELFSRKNFKIFQSLPPEEVEVLERMKVSVAASLISRGKILGILLLKGKLSGELYSYEDISFLGILCNQAAIALDNASFREKEKSMLQTMFHQKRLAMIGQMAASIAHEIRNPLVAVKGLGQLVEQSFNEGDSRIQHMKILNTEVNRLQNVVSELVRFARPTDLNRSEIDLNRCIQDALDLYHEEFKNRGVDVLFNPGTSPVSAFADPEKIKQVIINLIQNALEAMANGGVLSLETRVQRSSGFENLYASQAEIVVRDSGPGIPAEMREKIFEPFFSGKKSGTGLGLATARSIVEEHGGEITATDSAEGGAAFLIRLPVATPSSEVKTT
jgi:signal transduction histidine kinase